MTDIIERAENVLTYAHVPQAARDAISELLEALKAERAEVERLRRRATLPTYLTDIRSRVEHASRINLVDKGMRWPENHGELVDWVLSLPGIAIVDTEDGSEVLDKAAEALWREAQPNWPWNELKFRRMARAALLAAAVQAQEEER